MKVYEGSTLVAVLLRLSVVCLQHGDLNQKKFAHQWGRR
jgi:hypothetical protein